MTNSKKSTRKSAPSLNTISATINHLPAPQRIKVKGFAVGDENYIVYLADGWKDVISGKDHFSEPYVRESVFRIRRAVLKTKYVETKKDIQNDPRVAEATFEKGNNKVTLIRGYKFSDGSKFTTGTIAEMCREINAIGIDNKSISRAINKLVAS